MLERWERSGDGWGRHADRVREWGMPVSAWLIEHLALQPGYTVLELAAGPGDTGFMAAELVRPGGALISSDAAEAMLEVARERARRLGLREVEFKRLELEWIDLPTASVDAVVCRWGLMFAVDPSAALREIRRVLRPGGRVALAAWDLPERNPWATIPTRVLVSLELAEPPDPDAPGMFALAGEKKLGELLADAGFTDVEVRSVAVSLAYPSVDQYFEQTRDLSQPFREAVPESRRAEVVEAIRAKLEPFAENASFSLPGSSLVAAARA